MNPTHPLINTGPITSKPLFNAPATQPKTIIKVPYHGERASYFVYHPVNQWNSLTAFSEAKSAFLAMWKEFLDVVELYEDEQTHHEKIVTKETKRDVHRLVNEISGESCRNVYCLEALSEVLFDRRNTDEDEDGRGRKTETHYIPLHSDLEKRGQEIRAMDMGLKMARPIGQHETIRRSWSG